MVKVAKLTNTFGGFFFRVDEKKFEKGEGIWYKKDFFHIVNFNDKNKTGMALLYINAGLIIHSKQLQVGYSPAKFCLAKNGTVTIIPYGSRMTKKAF